MKRAKFGKLVICLLFVICYLLLACQVQVVPEQSAIPGGMGRVTLNLNGVSARTILPDPDALKLTDFVSYDLIFGAVAGLGGVDDDFKMPAFASGSTFAAVDLVPGTYGLTVKAYKSIAGVDVLAARGQQEIVVNAGPNDVDVVLRAVLDEGVGSFKWEVTLNTDPITLTSATMTIYKGSDQVGDVENLNLTGDTEGTPTPLASGVYTVRFNLVGSDATSPRAVVWNELMHVYATLTSNFEHEFTNNYFHRTHWNVTFDLNHTDYAGNSITGTQSVMHGATVADPDPDWPGYKLEGWFTADGTSGWGDKWDFDDDPIHDDMTLYAQWKLIEGAVTVTLDVEPINDAVFAIDPATPITFSLASDTTITVEVKGMTIDIGGTDVVDVFADYTFSWEIAGKGIYAEPATAQNVTVPGDFIILNNPDNRHIYGTVGTHTIVLTARPKAAGGRTYQRNVDFTIN